MAQCQLSADVKRFSPGYPFGPKGQLAQSGKTLGKNVTFGVSFHGVAQGVRPRQPRPPIGRPVGARCILFMDPRCNHCTSLQTIARRCRSLHLIASRCILLRVVACIACNDVQRCNEGFSILLLTEKPIRYA
jgi:hypothetical protein